MCYCFYEPVFLIVRVNICMYDYFNVGLYYNYAEGIGCRVVSAIVSKTEHCGFEFNLNGSFFTSFRPLDLPSLNEYLASSAEEIKSDLRVALAIYPTCVQAYVDHTPCQGRTRSNFNFVIDYTRNT